MDERIHRAYGQRLALLTQRDLPVLADAITMVLRKQGRVALHQGNPPYVRISGNGMNVLVLEEDWRKILPVLREGFLDTSLYPVETEIGLEALVQFDSAWIAYRDEQFREKVLGILGQLFSRSYPTSKI